MGVHCPCLGAPYPTVHPIPLYHGTGGTVHGSTLSHLRAPYPIVYRIPLYHGTGGTVHGSPLSLLRGPHIPLSVLSHCTMGWVGLSMGVRCPCLGAPYPTVRPIPLYHGTGGTVYGSTLSLLKGSISHCPSYPTVPWDGWDCPWEYTVPSEGPISYRLSYPTVPWDGWDCPWESTVPALWLRIPLSVLSYCTMGRVGLSMGVHCPCLGAPYPTVRPIPLYHGTGGTVHGSPLSHLRAPISYCPI